MVSVYLDHAATTPIDPAVVAAMQPYLGDDFGNPSARYGLGVRALEALDGARRTMRLDRVAPRVPAVAILPEGG